MNIFPKIVVGLTQFESIRLIETSMNIIPENSTSSLSSTMASLFSSRLPSILHSPSESPCRTKKGTCKPLIIARFSCKHVTKARRRWTYIVIMFNSLVHVSIQLHLLYFIGLT